MTEARCPKCKALLFKIEGDGARIEAKCRKCGNIVKMRIRSETILSDRADFIARVIERRLTQDVV